MSRVIQLSVVSDVLFPSYNLRRYYSETCADSLNMPHSYKLLLLQIMQELRKTVYMICKSDEDDRRPVIIRASQNKGNSVIDSPTATLPQYSSSPADNAERERLASLEKDYREMKDQMTELRHLSASQKQQPPQTPGDTFYIAPARGIRSRGANTPNSQQNQSYVPNQQRHATPESLLTSHSKSILSSGQNRNYGTRYTQRQVR